jgi:LysR family hydrogen peroxide-inducible transcriptional activator
MNIRDLEYIVAVAEEGHFGRAAERCFVTQPTLSGQIRKLEDHLDVTLFERTNRRVQLTDAGAAVVERAKTVLRGVEEIESAARSWSDPYSGPMRLGVIPTIGPYLVPLILAGVRVRMPRVQLIFQEEITARLSERLSAGKIDAAVIATAVEAEEFEEWPLYDEPFYLAVPSTGEAELPTPVMLESIDPERLLLLSDGHCLRDQAVAACRMKPDTLGINTRASSLETIMALVAGGEGMTLVPALYGVSGVAEKIRLLDVSPPGTGRKVRLIARRSFPRRQALERLVGIIRERVSIPGAPAET